MWRWIQTARKQPILIQQLYRASTEAMCKSIENSSQLVLWGTTRTKNQQVAVGIRPVTVGILLMWLVRSYNTVSTTLSPVASRQAGCWGSSIRHRHTSGDKLPGLEGRQVVFAWLQLWWKNMGQLRCLFWGHANSVLLRTHPVPPLHISTTLAPVSYPGFWEKFPHWLKFLLPFDRTPFLFRYVHFSETTFCDRWHEWSATFVIPAAI